MDPPEFQEIVHCGGQFVVTTRRDEQGGREYQLGFKHCSPGPAALVGIYALPQGIPVGMIQLGGIGQAWNPPPFSGCLSVFLASDSHGKFGHECPQCKGYWRSSGPAARWPMTCTYCGLRASAHEFLTKGQRAYVDACCRLIGDAMDAGEDGEHVIDMDAAVDAAKGKTERPKFYYAEESQQTRFTCTGCGHWNDILGRFGYCSSCGARNDLAQIDALVRAVRERINAGGEGLPACVRDLVSAFDTMAEQYANQLVEHVPLSARRKAMFEGRFHDLRRCAEAFKSVFDIDLLEGQDEGAIKFAAMMFERRHVYEHKGGEADEAYIRKSGDNSVRPKQVIRETQENAHKLASMVGRFARRLHEGFHQLLPAEEEPLRLKERH